MKSEKNLFPGVEFEIQTRKLVPAKLKKSNVRGS